MEFHLFRAVILAPLGELNNDLRIRAHSDVCEALLVSSNRLRSVLVGLLEVRVPVEASLELLSSLCVELSTRR